MVGSGSNRFTVRSSSSDFKRGREVLLGIENHSGDIIGAIPPFVIEFRDVPPGTILDATIGSNMGQEFLQAALEEAWRIGLRPTGYLADTSDQVRAMRAHLDDMRRLVFSERTIVELPMGEALNLRRTD